MEHIHNGKRGGQEVVVRCEIPEFRASTATGTTAKCGAIERRTNHQNRIR